MSERESEIVSDKVKDCEKESVAVTVRDWLLPPCDMLSENESVEVSVKLREADCGSGDRERETVREFRDLVILLLMVSTLTEGDFLETLLLTVRVSSCEVECEVLGLRDGPDSVSVSSKETDCVTEREGPESVSVGSTVRVGVCVLNGESE